MVGMITADNLHTKTDNEIRAAIECYGRLWNPWEPQCAPCLAQARCVHRLATETLPQEAKERGAYDPDHATGQIFPRPERLDLNELAPEFQTDVRALKYALEYAKDPKMGLPVIQPNGALLPSNSGPPRIEIGGAVPPPEPKKEEPKAPPATVEEAMQAAADGDLPEELLEVVEAEGAEPVEIDDELEELEEEAQLQAEEALAIVEGPAKEKKVKTKKVAAKKPPIQKKAPPAKKVPPPKVKAKKTCPTVASIPDQILLPFNKEKFEKDPFPFGTVLARGLARTTKTKDGWTFGANKFHSAAAVSMAMGNIDHGPQAQKLAAGGRAPRAGRSVDHWFTDVTPAKGKK